MSAGPETGKIIKDRVIGWPVSFRTECVAKALGVDASLLGQEIGSRVGSELRVRRNVVIREDGTTRMANFYYPLENPTDPVLG